MASSPSSDSADSTLVRRARRRLIGSIALVLVAVIALPMIFDDEKKPLDQDVSVQIPSQDVVTVRPAGAPGTGKTVEPKLPAGQAAGAAATSPEAAQDKGGVADKPVVPAKDDGKPAAAPEDGKSVAKVERKSEPDKKAGPERNAELEKKVATKVDAAAEAKPATKGEEARVKAILDGAAGGAVKDGGGFAVQIGAFASDDKVREAREKLSAAGYKSFVEKLDTKDGERTRVRAGPFGTRDSAEAARDKIRGAGFNGATVVTR